MLDTHSQLMLHAEALDLKRSRMMANQRCRVKRFADCAQGKYNFCASKTRKKVQQ